MNMTPEKIDEIIARHTQRDQWADAAPFYKGMFWSPDGGLLRGDENPRYSRYEIDRPNLLTVRLPGSLRRTDIEAARAGHPASAVEIDALGRALDDANFTFADDVDFLGKRGHGDSVSADIVHRSLIDTLEPRDDEALIQIAHAAERLSSAAKVGLRGVLLRYEKGRHGGMADHYALVPMDNGYALDPKQRENTIDDGDWLRTEFERLEVVGTPSLYGLLAGDFADPLFCHAQSNNGGSMLIACVIADMVAHGETSVILRLVDRKEFVLADLNDGLSIFEIAGRVRNIVSRHDIVEVVRVMPGPRPRHRFYVVGGLVVADSASVPDLIEIGHVAVLEYRKADGKADVLVSSREDIGEVAAMRAFCEACMQRICALRPNWIIDVELEGGRPFLAGIEEIYDGQWFGDVDGLVMTALVARQDTAFSEVELVEEEILGGLRSSKRTSEAEVASAQTEDAAPG